MYKINDQTAATKQIILINPNKDQLFLYDYFIPLFLVLSGC